MKNIIIKIFLLVILISCDSDDDQTTNITLKKLDTIKYYNIDDNLTKIAVYKYENDKLIQIIIDTFVAIIYTYENNRVIKKSRLSTTNDTLISNYEYTGELITKVLPDYESVLYYEFIYNSLNQLITSKGYNGETVTFEANFEFDDNDNLTDINNPFLASRVFEYDNKNNPYYYSYPIELNRIKHYGKNNLLSEESEFSLRTYEYDYNLNDQPLIKRSYENGVLFEKTEYIYQ